MNNKHGLILRKIMIAEKIDLSRSKNEKVGQIKFLSEICRFWYQHRDFIDRNTLMILTWS